MNWFISEFVGKASRGIESPDLETLEDKCPETINRMVVQDIQGIHVVRNILYLSKLSLLGTKKEPLFFSRCLYQPNLLHRQQALE